VCRRTRALRGNALTDAHGHDELDGRPATVHAPIHWWKLAGPSGSDGDHHWEATMAGRGAAADQLVQRLLSNAYLFDDPSSYEAGVIDTLSLLEDVDDRERADEVQRVGS
jgi:hypothetical protein